MKVKYMGKTQDVIVRGHSVREKLTALKHMAIIAFSALVFLFVLELVAYAIEHGRG